MSSQKTSVLSFTKLDIELGLAQPQLVILLYYISNIISNLKSIDKKVSNLADIVFEKMFEKAGHLKISFGTSKWGVFEGSCIVVAKVGNVDNFFSRYSHYYGSLLHC